MRPLFFFLILSLSVFNARSNPADTIKKFELPDSIKAVQFYSEITMHSNSSKKENSFGIRTSVVEVALDLEGDKKEIVFEFPRSASIVARGMGVKVDKDELEWEINGRVGDTYRFLIAVANDSAGNFSLYSGYAWLPRDSKWKLIGTCRVNGIANTIKEASTFIESKRNSLQASIGQSWIQRSNGSWKNLGQGQEHAPIINLMGHADSIARFEEEKILIQKAINTGQLDVKENKEGVFYNIISAGTGKQVSVNDTVSVLYRLHLLGDSSTVDQALEKPASFPLKRLIRGWQIGVPLLRVGGKMRMVIPSVHAYSIRTRSPKIPPNSILVFEIEVLDSR